MGNTLSNAFQSGTRETRWVIFIAAFLTLSTPQRKESVSLLRCEFLGEKVFISITKSLYPLHNVSSTKKKTNLPKQIDNCNTRSKLEYVKILYWNFNVLLTFIFNAITNVFYGIVIYNIHLFLWRHYFYCYMLRNSFNFRK